MFRVVGELCYRCRRERPAKTLQGLCPLPLEFHRAYIRERVPGNIQVDGLGENRINIWHLQNIGRRLLHDLSAIMVRLIAQEPAANVTYHFFSRITFIEFIMVPTWIGIKPESSGLVPGSNIGVQPDQLLCYRGAGTIIAE